MTEKTFFTGFGGQGIISLGQIWAFCAMKEGKNVTFFPFYGAEKRGGIARANVIISDSEIASPVISKADSVVVMNQDSLAAAEQVVRTDGLMLVNTSLVTTAPRRTDVRVLGIPATDAARNSGSEKAANMVMFGALAAATHAFSLDRIASYFADFFQADKQHLIPVNVRAVMEGRTCLEACMCKC
jgi:Pyruvate:ferredoxin oxidoreductase and related 2-oxoacid:ferredoxin oxidoreductases, gamma subunit